MDNDDKISEKAKKAANRALELKEAIRNAVLALREAKETVSARSVLAKVGKGSMGTILPIYNQVLAELPDIPPETEGRFKQVISALSDSTRQAVDTATETLKKELATAKADSDAVVEELNNTRLSLEKTEIDFQEEKSTNASLVAVKDVLEKDLAELRAKFEEINNNFVELKFSRKMLEDLKGEIKSVSVTKADLAQAVDKLTEVLKLEIKSASVPIEQKISDAMDKLTSATTNKQTTEVGSVSKLRQKSSSKKG